MKKGATGSSGMLLYKYGVNEIIFNNPAAFQGKSECQEKNIFRKLGKSDKFGKSIMCKGKLGVLIQHLNDEKTFGSTKYRRDKRKLSRHLSVHDDNESFKSAALQMLCAKTGFQKAHFGTHWW